MHQESYDCVYSLLFIIKLKSLHPLYLWIKFALDLTTNETSFASSMRPLQTIEINE
jgi:hypothetical protein